MSKFLCGIVGAGIIAMTSGALAEDISIGQLIDFTGPTSDVGQTYGVGVIDAIRYINAKGGINGKGVALDTQDYAYQATRAVTQYKRWADGGNVSAIYGWGTADAEALVQFVTRDQIVYFSAAYAASLADPTGAGNAGHPAPFNFFYGPSYSDAARAMLDWAAADAKTKNLDRKPRYVHLGANHPYPNSPKQAAEDYAVELGFEVLPAIQYPLAPGDFTAQCLTLKQSGADYAYLGNTSGSTIALLKSCETANVEVTFLGNVWGVDENGLRAAGTAADGVILPVRTQVTWGDDSAPGMSTLREIAELAGDANAYRSLHYLSGVCSAFYLAEAIDRAATNGEISGPNIKKALENESDWVPAGLEGVCYPSTWTSDDHRGTARAAIYRARVTGLTQAPLEQLMADGTIRLERLAEIDIPRKQEWLGK